jgi:zinc protease
MHSQVAVRKLTLSNGLSILSIPSKQAPVVALQGWIRFGSADETDDIAGVAHLFEHLLFKGTKTRAVGQIAKEVEGLGGDLNAYTTYDHTVMHMTLPAKAFEKGLEILADSLLNSTVEPDELERERPVILEEIKRRNDMPGAIASDLLRAQLFKDHPYSRPVIGYVSVVESIPRDTIMEQYRRHYNSRNLFLVISGDFDESQLIKQCEKYFKDLPPGPIPPPHGPSRTVRAPIVDFRNHSSPDSLLNLGWQAPKGSDDAAAALDALALIIGQGESSRLVRKLVFEEQLLREIGAGCWSPKSPGSFVIGMKGPAGTSKNFPKILKAIQEALEPAITPSELEKAKRNLLSMATYSKETVDGLAQRFGYFESIANDWSMDSKYLKNVESLTLFDVEKAKKDFLSWDRVVAAGIVPEKDPLPVFEKPRLLSTKSTSHAESPHGVVSFDHNGLKVVVKTMKHLPIFSLRWVGWGGGRLEPATQSGVGSLWARSVTSGGTGNDHRLWTRKALNEYIDLSCASLNAFHGRNSYGYQLDGLSHDFESLMEPLLAIRHEPTFDKKILEQDRMHTLADIKSMKDSPSSVASLMFMNSIFGKHSYGRPSIGTPEIVKKITSAQVRKYHETMHKQPQVLTLVGDITPERVQKLLEQTLGREKFAKKSLLSKKHPLKYPLKAVSKREKLKKEQTHILLGVPTCTIFDKDRWSLLGLSSVLSGQGGRLFVELRDKMSLCYTVSPTHMEGLDGGYFGFYIATSPEKELTAVEALHKEIRRFVEEGINDEEWQKAYRFYSGNYQIEQQKFSTQATGMALDELYGFGYEDYFNFEKHLSELSAESLTQVARKYFSEKAMKHLVSTVVGPT